MSPRQRHKVLAQLAEDALSETPFEPQAYFARYAELISWTELDAFQVPTHLTAQEALGEIAAFHRHLSQTTATPASGVVETWRAKHDLTVVLDGVRTPYNVGSVLRLIDNFGLAGLVLGSHWPDWQHAQLRKAARGCEAWIPKQHQPELAAWLGSCDMPVYGLETGDDAVELVDWQPQLPGVLVLGSERHGLTAAVRAKCDQLVRIPMWGYKHSMNVSHALAVAVWHALAKGSRPS